jgi:3-dehydroquinate synthetase/predicted NBD/HSP70 family sugar kinase
MNTFPVALGFGDEVIVFDLGGTTFRSALLNHEGQLTKVQRTPSINARSMPGKSGAEIVDAIASYIANTVLTLWDSMNGRRAPVAISMGAALNAHTGEILGSGPILGEDSTTFDLEKAIKRYLKGARISIVNDVTAAVIGHSRMDSLRHIRQIALITVSSGIASRTYNCSLPHVPVDGGIGTQGEIGHHQIKFSINGHAISLKCDCGGVDHLNAFASGNGINRVLSQLREVMPEEFKASHLSNGSDPTLDTLADGLKKGDELCKKVLAAVTAPIADAIRWHFTLNPEIDKMILTGGVCFFLRDFYLTAVLDHLSASALYPSPLSGDAFWADRVMLGPVSDDAGLIGAAFVGREHPRVHRRETLDLEPPYRVSRQSGTDYSIHVAENILQGGTFPEHLLENFDRIILMIDSKVEHIYGEAIRRVLAGTYRKVETHVMRVSEKSKDLFAVADVITAFENSGVRRRKDLIVACGGGITMDIVALGANLFRRGVPCMRLPTTLVGLIDAGIGVKNAINFRQSKSRLGTYCAPYAVVIDPCFITTLPEREIRNGLSEALKIGLVVDRRLFEVIEEHSNYLIRSKMQSEPGMEVILRSIRAMMLELAPNLYERSLDRFPDYGHTFSPIFEFELSDLEHGEAVALDMAVSTGLAVNLGFLRAEDAERILATQHALALPITRAGLCLDMLTRGAQEAKKHRGGQLRMPVLCGLGEALFIDDVTDRQLEEALDFVESWYTGRTTEVAKSA